VLTVRIHATDAPWVSIDVEDSGVGIHPEAIKRSVDDFGTGYSSISYLRRFPIDKLKIDRGFVKDLMTRKEDASIVRAIISLAHGLRLKVIAEGVETAEQLQFLQNLGCDQYQGYHFSPPLSALDFAKLARTWVSADDSFSEDDAARTHSKLSAIR
jgi:EAL domain-containing protein (putative c-di-GMP-specific phosphodiesterase class I)